jgi:LPXTG-motif cell wall-anchored protein
VSHRLFQDYYGEDMLEITISDYYHSQEPIQLTCSVYVNGSTTPANVSLPYDPDVLSTGKTTTITVPLAALVDIDTTEKARFIINPRGITETARVNNEFTVYPGGKAEITPLVIAGQPQSTAVPIGERVLFNVGVTGGKAPYSYQWQVFTGGEWKDLPSENAATLTLDKAKLEWNGRRTRCVITDANGTTVVSDEAVLTVTGTDATAGNAQPDTGDHMRLPLYLAVALIAIILLVLLRRRERD